MAGTEVTVVANGSAQLIDPFAATLETRLATQLAEWYQVLGLELKRTYGNGFSFYYDYQANVRLATKGGLNARPLDVASVTESMKLAAVLATGYPLSAVAVTSSGQTAPTAPAPGVIDSVSEWPKAIADLVRQLAAGVGVTIETAKYLIIAIGLGIAGLIYFIVRQPGTAARIARG